MGAPGDKGYIDGDMNRVPKFPLATLLIVSPRKELSEPQKSYIFWARISSNHVFLYIHTTLCIHIFLEMANVFILHSQ